MICERLGHYLVSLPERAVRSISALAGGALHELGDVALPVRVRRSKLYDSLVESTIRFLVEQVGQVEAVYPAAEALPADFLIRRTAGNVMEIAGFAVFRASPVWVLGALSDLAGVGRDLVSEIAAELQAEGLLEKDSRFETVDQLLDGLERTSARLAEAVNTPPLNVPALREEWDKLQREAASIPRAFLPPADRLWSQWRELQRESAGQGRSVLEVSSVMALAAVRKLPENIRWLSNAVRAGGRRTGRVMARGLLDHYSNTLAEIRETGYARYWLREFRPYLEGAVRQFSPERISTTEHFLRRSRPGRS